MKLLLILKHWQLAILFLLLFTLGNRIENDLLSSFFVDFLFLLFVFWIFSIGYYGNKKLPMPRSMELLYTCLIIVLVYVLPQPFIQINWPTVPGTILAAITVFAFIYIVYFSSKTYKMVESKQHVLAGDWLPIFFGIYLFIFGIWVIQPKLNKWYTQS